ncbi:hypothetical protein PPL_07736 [Heterostelium album PN500]|uniref:Uncharacterized protein n=1 Tax=Heterostelium pallidum (strain ATCC 26659 / Pp 5 / PN500) TaxID=670386 RepID=D3BGT4_HETP5|nr:hypothetical protein PPL_07736 [Heterostelium album PN500]EFA79318.1 hypothetical protein PPL_07736 [Heterostelium album PN500]|eukprot:XP_020431439.1 hypothetical protein PPL_07736 [Heterostelium album PN500]
MLTLGFEIEDKAMFRSLTNSLLPKCITESTNDRYYVMFTNGSRFEVVNIEGFNFIDISSIKTIESKMLFVAENFSQINKNEGFILSRKYNLHDYLKSDKLPKQAFYFNGMVVITYLSVSIVHGNSVGFLGKCIVRYLDNNHINGVAPGERNINFGNNSYTTDNALSLYPVPPSIIFTNPLVVECRRYFENPYVNVVLGVHIWDRKPQLNGTYNAVAFYYRRSELGPRAVRVISFGSTVTTRSRESKLLTYSGLQDGDLEGHLWNHPNPVIDSVAPYIISIPAVDIFGHGHIYQNLPNLEFDLFQLKANIDVVPNFSMD